MYLGLDVGTTSVCAVVLGDDGTIVYTATKQNSFHLESKEYERTQDPDGIVRLCQTLYFETLENFPIRGVGVTGQMHGIVYIDKNGQAISPLYSWQDERGNLPFESSTYAKTLSSRSGHAMATGFGCVSLFYDAVNGKIPEETKSFCTIGDYVAMKLAGRTSPLLHETNAASLGLYDVRRHRWDKDAILQSALPSELFPETTEKVVQIGKTKESVAVFTAIGDNQASVYGAEKDPDSVIVNVGTGSQISVICERYFKPPVDCEIRPYFHGRYLASGCALCGGYAYRLLKDFFNTVSEKEIDYATMNEWAKSAMNSPLPETKPIFRGKRSNPSLRASVVGISEENFNAAAITLSFLKGIGKELKDMYDELTPITGTRGRLIGSGNAIRMNPVLRQIVEADYGMPLNVPSHKEEAAFGAALLAAETLENKNLKSFVRYEK